jgi:hypothetical protein
MLGWTKKIDAHKLRSEWTSCLQAAAKKMGVAHLPINTRDGLVVANVKRVVPKVRNGETVTLDDAIRETCKYTMKGSDLSDVPKEHLSQVESVLHRRKMVVSFGECNKQRGTARKAEYLDLTNTTDGSLNIGETSQNEKKARGESLRDVGSRMIREGRRELWLEMLAFIYAERREYRKVQLADKYPNATFRTLDGKVFGRASINPLAEKAAAWAAHSTSYSPVFMDWN